MASRTGSRGLLGLLAGGLALACADAPPATPTPSWQAKVERWVWPAPIPSVPLVDQAGRSFRLGSLADRWVLLGFIYTRCKVGTACPLTTAKMKQALTLWEAEGPGAPPLHLLSLTLDPAWDTPERLAAYAAQRGLPLDRWTLATGPDALMREGLPSLFNVLALPDESGEITHTVRVALLAPGLREVADWKDEAFEPAQVVARMREAQAPGAGR